MDAIKVVPKKRKSRVNIEIIIVAFAAIIFAIPIYITFVGGFKDNEIIIRHPLALPIPGTFQNFHSILTDPTLNIIRIYLNTIFITAVSMTVTLLISALAAFYTSRGKSKTSRFLYIYFILGLMIPYQMIFLGVVQILKRMHLIGTYPGIIFVFIAGNIMFSVFMYHGFMKSIPKELEESAAIDGAGQFRTFCQVIFPLLKPCTTTTAVFIGLGMWNDFYTPLIVLGGGKLSTITLGIYNSIGQFQTSWGNVFAYVLLASIPVIIAYIFGQKYIISGLTAGALKG